MTPNQQFLLALLTPILTFLGTVLALYYSHLKTQEVVKTESNRTNLNIENVENHLGILPTQINARLDPLIPGSITNKENVEKVLTKDISIPEGHIPGGGSKSP